MNAEMHAWEWRRFYNDLRESNEEREAMQKNETISGGFFNVHELDGEWEVVLGSGFDSTSLGIFGTREQAEYFIADLCRQAQESIGLEL